MEAIKTTATLVEKMRDEAKELARESGNKLAQCQEIVARRHQYDSWKHVTLCASTPPGDDTKAAPVLTLARALDGYFEDLGRRRLAPVQVNEPKGSTFYDITVEGCRFKGQAYDNPLLERSDIPSNQAPFGVSKIINRTSTSRTIGMKRWENVGGLFVCKYNGAEPRVPLSGLTAAGVNAVATHFGLVIHDDVPFSGGRYLDTFGGYPLAYAFFRSHAAEALQRWCVVHPRKSKKINAYTDYLLHWTRFIGQEWPKPKD